LSEILDLRVRDAVQNRPFLGALSDREHRGLADWGGHDRVTAPACKTWSAEPSRFRSNPLHQMLEPNIRIWAAEQQEGDKGVAHPMAIAHSRLPATGS
jgi:hypothetical protein